MARQYTRNDGANPPGNPGKPILGVAMTDRQGQTKLYLLDGFRGTRRTYVALRLLDVSKGCSFFHYKAQEILDAAIRRHGIVGTIHNDESGAWLET